jgi:hypothetical protein
MPGSSTSSSLWQQGRCSMRRRSVRMIAFWTLRGRGRYAVMTWDRREANPWLGLVLDAVGAQFGVPFPPPNVRGPFSLDTPDLLTCVLRDRGLEGVTLTTIDVGSLAVIPLAVVVALMLARRLPNQYR